MGSCGNTATVACSVFVNECGGPFGCGWMAPFSMHRDAFISLVILREAEKEVKHFAALLA